MCELFADYATLLTKQKLALLAAAAQIGIVLPVTPQNHIISQMENWTMVFCSYLKQQTEMRFDNNLINVADHVPINKFQQ